LTEILEAMTRPDANGTPALPKRTGPKGLLPSTWVERTLRVAYMDCYGDGQEASRTSTRPADRRTAAAAALPPTWRRP
jgi:hypothetical protein